MPHRSSILRFDAFELDRANRQLRREGAPVELGSRYFDALVLMAEQPGELVSKDRFMDEVWRGIPVTDEALTQCIRTLRRAVGDEAGNPRFIQTVPKHGYRFLAAIEEGGAQEEAEPDAPTSASSAPAASIGPNTSQGPGRLAAAATLGGTGVGAVGGMFYGVAAASGGGSTGLVLAALVGLLGTLAGAGIGLGMASAVAWRGRMDAVLVAGAMLGGLAVGAFGGTMGRDGIGLLTSVRIGEVAGPVEGLAMGGAIGLALWIAWVRQAALPVACALAATLGAVGGLAIHASGGRLLGGSLYALQQGLGDTRLRLETLSALLGEAGFGPLTLRIATVAEGALLATAMVAAILLALGGNRRG